MSEPRLSAATRSLLRAAKVDAPSAAARAKVWSSVASVAGGAGAAGTAGAAGAASTPSMAPGLAVGGTASKMLLIGTLLGGTVTVGLTAMLLHVGPVHETRPRSSAPMAAAPLPAAVPTMEEPSPGATQSLLASDPVAATPGPLTAIAAGAPPMPPGPASNPARVAPFPVVPVVGLEAAGSNRTVVHQEHVARPGRATPDDALAREAGLLAAAHAALVRGEPQAALRAVRAAEALPSHALGPEELSVEGQALRALGREGQANEVDSTLKKQFPDSALAH